MTEQTNQPEQAENTIIHISAMDDREQRRRRFEIIAALVLLLFIMGATWTQLTYYGVDSWLFIVLFNINSVFMLIILFLVARNVVKLIMERRRKVFGARMRTRLVVVFVSLSLVPTVLMFLASNRVVATSVDYWFTSQTESSLQAALDVGRSFYAASADRLRARSEAILREVVERKLVWGGPAMDALLIRKQKEYGLTLVGVINNQGNEQNWHAPESFQNIWKETRGRIDWQHVSKNTFGSLLWATENADYVIGLLAIDNGRTGYLVTAESIGQGLMAKLDGITKGFEEYAQLKQLKKPLKVSFQLILGVLGLITIFGSVWFGFRLSKEITAPILALAEGTNRIAKGDLNFRLDDKGTDELGLLVQSFNSMAGDLQEGRTSLTLANAQLAQQNQAVAERNRYIETVLDNITTGVVTLDAEGLLLTMNKAACAIFSANSSKLNGRSPNVFLPNDYGPLFDDMLETFTDNPDQHWQRHVDFTMGNRSWKLIIHAVALHGPQGIDAYVVVIEDITELEKMQRMAAWREVAKRIAHEIKNPLTPIKLSAQRLERKFGAQVQDPAFSQCTDMIVKQVERMQEMVQEFSSFAKLPEIRVSPGKIEPLLEELVTLFRNSHSQVLWELRVPKTLPPIAMDTAALHRAFLNILTNAAEAVENQPVRRVRVFALHNTMQETVRVVISDTGEGLSPEARERLFEPYFSRKQGGTGLGLAIVKSIVTDHHGTIRATGTHKKGTAIIVDLPVERMA